MKDLTHLNKLEKQQTEKHLKRFWMPVVIYIYGPGGSGKSGLVQQLFRNQLYIKPKKQQNGSNWWNGYNKQDIIFLDEWYTCFNWNDVVKYLNDTEEEVEIKGKGFIPFLGKYIFMTSRKPPNEAFNFGNRGFGNDSIQRDFTQFERRLKFIIEFTGKWDDNIEQRTTQIHFHKGSEQEFRSMLWNLKFDRGDLLDDEIIEKINSNGFTNGEIIFNNNEVYWQENFPEYKKKYLQDYPNCKFLFEYKRDEEQNNKRKHDESFNLDNEESFSSNNSENSNKCKNK